MKKIISRISSFHNSKGISLIALIVTIIVIIILSSILYFSADKSLTSSEEAKFETQLRKLLDSLKIYHEKAELESFTYDRSKLSWDGGYVEPTNTGKVYDGTSEDTADFILGEIPEYFRDKISIEEGELKYSYSKFTPDEAEWIKKLDKGQKDSTTIASTTIRITFNANGGTVNGGIRDVVPNTQIGSLPVARKTNYVFKGWFTLEDGGDQITESTIASSDATYFAHWSAAVAQIDSDYFETITAAINSVPDGGDTKTIKLLVDLSNNITIGAEKSIIFNLQGHSISCTTNSPSLENNGTLTITNGTVSSTKNLAIKNKSSGILTVDGVTLSTTSTGCFTNDGGSALIKGNSRLSSGNTKAVYNTGSLVINGATITSSNDRGIDGSGGSLEIRGSSTVNSKIYNSNGSEMTISGGTFNGNTITNSATLTISGGSINSRISNTSSLTISGGEFAYEGNTSITNSAAGTLNISGGTITITGSGSAVTNNGSATISQGTFSTQSGNTIQNSGSSSSLSISGGTFSSNTASAVTNSSGGFVEVSGGNLSSTSINKNTLSNTGSNSRVEISGTAIIFSKSQSAVSNESSSTMTITGGDISSEGTSSGAAAAINNKSSASLYVSGGFIHGVGSGGKARQGIYNDGGKAYISGNAIISSNADGTRGTIQNQGNGILEITGGTITCSKAAAIYVVNGTVTIGVNDDTIDKTTPVIQSNKNGLMNNAKVYFYDGIIRGKVSNAAITNTTNIDCDSTKNRLVTGEQEVVDGTNYNIAYIAVK